MGTPLKSLQKLLSPRLRQPFLSNSSKRLNKPPAIRNRNIAKRLDFTSANFEKNGSPINKTNISVTISNCATEIIGYTDSVHKKYNNIIINTPNKLELQKNGLQPFQNTFVIGKGTFGSVVKGIFKGTTVAIKIVKNQVNIREKNALQLQHDNIIKIIEIFEDCHDNFAIIIMENEEACQNLQELIDNQDHNLAFNKIFKIALDVSFGIEFCHKNNILHLDLKPKNILINYYGNAKICDFGNSYKIGSGTKYIHYGTIIYTAPEILTGQPPTVFCDIYSLGIVFWQMETLKIPFEDLLCKEIVIYKVVKSNMRPKLPTIMADIQYGYLYTKCWHTIPIDRPQITTVINILKDIAKSKYMG